MQQAVQDWVDMGMLDFAVEAALRAGNEPTFEFMVGNLSFERLDPAISFGLDQKALTGLDISVDARLRKNGIIVFTVSV
jgi:hypothetical protein